jgi:hypothetical protein
VDAHRLICVKHLEANGRRIPVLLFRNGTRSVAAHCILKPGDTPILDGPTAEDVLALVEGVLGDLLLARAAVRPSV